MESDKKQEFMRVINLYSHSRLSDVEYKELINCKIELEPDKKEKLMKDFEAKSLILKNVKEITKKYITKSI